MSRGNKPKRFNKGATAMTITIKQLSFVTVIIMVVALFVTFSTKSWYLSNSTSFDAYSLIFWSIATFLIIVTKLNLTVISGKGTAKVTQKIISNKGLIAISITFTFKVFMSLLVNSYSLPSLFTTIGDFVFLSTLIINIIASTPPQTESKPS
jgi:hypothetical protein